MLSQASGDTKQVPEDGDLIRTKKSPPSFPPFPFLFIPPKEVNRKRPASVGRRARSGGKSSSRVVEVDLAACGALELGDAVSQLLFGALLELAGAFSGNSEPAADFRE